jgi:predicted PurR-regulated permease PerM
MQDPNPAAPPSVIANRAADLAIRLVALGLLVAWCFLIIRPFAATLIWGGILAVAIQPVHRLLASGLADRDGLAAALLGAAGLALIFGPVSLLAASFVSGIEALAQAFTAGRLVPPPPPEWLTGVPFFGQRLHDLWALASVNLVMASDTLAPLARDLGERLLALAGAAGLTVLQFAVAMVIAAVLLPRAASANAGIARLAERLAPARGATFVTLAAQTVRNVARGVIGVAMLQGLMMGAGFLLAGIPLPGLWTFLCVALAILQIGTAPVAIVTIIYAWQGLDTPWAVLFTVWMIFASVIDNVLKPVLMAKGLPTPMAVIVLGLLGGTLLHGLIGLFVGPVVLAMGYDLLRLWMADKPDVTAPPSTPGTGPDR